MLSRGSRTLRRSLLQNYCCLNNLSVIYGHLSQAGTVEQGVGRGPCSPPHTHFRRIKKNYRIKSSLYAIRVNIIANKYANCFACPYLGDSQILTTKPKALSTFELEDSSLSIERCCLKNLEESLHCVTFVSKVRGCFQYLVSVQPICVLI